jgi:hypothetical protein
MDRGTPIPDSGGLTTPLRFPVSGNRTIVDLGGAVADTSLSFAGYQMAVGA